MINFQAAPAETIHPDHTRRLFGLMVRAVNEQLD